VLVLVVVGRVLVAILVFAVAFYTCYLSVCVLWLRCFVFLLYAPAFVKAVMFAIL
jgi:hypothetical protein